MPQPHSRLRRVLSVSLCLGLLLPFGRSQAILDLKYVKPLHCPNMALSTQLRYQTRAVRSLLQCLAACRASAACVSVVHERATDLCHLGSSPAMQNCSNMEPTGPDVDFYEQKVICQNGGTVATTTDSCLCAEPYYGDRCEKIMRDCYDVKDSGKLAVAPYVIFPTSSSAPFSVYCLPPMGRTYVFRHIVGNVDFNRPWQEYEDGFGHVVGDHWLGLRHMRDITLNDRLYRLMFILTVPSGVRYYTEYKDFIIGGSADGYPFSMNSNVVPKKAHDCLSALVGAPFSTYDNDSDGSALINCAQRHGAGWWYKGDSCSSVCSPLSLLSSATNLWSGNFAYAFWSTVNGTVSLSEVVAFLF